MGVVKNYADDGQCFLCGRKIKSTPFCKISSNVGELCLHSLFCLEKFISLLENDLAEIKVIEKENSWNYNKWKNSVFIADRQENDKKGF